MQFAIDEYSIGLHLAQSTCKNIHSKSRNGGIQAVINIGTLLSCGWQKGLECIDLGVRDHVVPKPRVQDHRCRCSRSKNVNLVSGGACLICKLQRTGQRARDPARNDG